MRHDDFYIGDPVGRLRKLGTAAASSPAPELCHEAFGNEPKMFPATKIGRNKCRPLTGLGPAIGERVAELW